MAQFKASVKYFGIPIVIECDDFKEFHEILAGITEINTDLKTLTNVHGISADNIVLVHRITQSGHTYFEIADSVSGKKITLGEYDQNKQKRAFPFFPKGQGGYFDPVKHKENDRPGENTDNRAREPGY